LSSLASFGLFVDILIFQLHAWPLTSFSILLIILVIVKA
jgi:hypothetical protein